METITEFIKSYVDFTIKWACTKQYIQNARQYLRDNFNNANPTPPYLAIGIVDLACTNAVYNNFSSNGIKFTDKVQQTFIKLREKAINAAGQYVNKANFGDYQTQNNSNTAKGAAAGGIFGALLGGNLLGVGLSALAGGLLGSTNKKEPDYDLFFSYVKVGIEAWYTAFLPEFIKFLDSHSKQLEEKNNVKEIQNKLDDAENRLNELIGLQSIKRQILLLKASIKKQKKLNNKINLHMCFYGNPGTGKTEVARLIADIFYKEKILETNKVIETDRSGLVGEYVGQTGPKTHAVIQKAMGGVLFIDEAYALDGGYENDFGKEAVATLLKDMEDYRDKICVILAGYKDEMVKLFKLNPGFKSRVNRIIEFPNYSKNELKEILLLISKNAKYTIEDDAVDKIIDVVDAKRNNPDFANAREVRNVFDAVVEVQALRTEDKAEDTNIKLCDVDEYLKNR